MNFKRISNDSEWEKYYHSALFKTFFHSPEWEGFLEKEFRWLKFERYLYKDSALLCLAHFKIFGKDRFVSHPFCEYGGPLPLKEGIDFDEFKKDVLTEFKNIKIKFHPEILKYNIRKSDFGKSDFPEEVGLRHIKKTYFIENLKTLNAEQLFSSFRKTLRHSIQKAEKENIIIKPCQNLRELKEFYRLHLLNVKRQKTWAFPYSFFEYFFKSDTNIRIHPNDPNKNDTNKAQIIIALYKNKIIAGSVFLFYDKFAHYFINASDQKYKHLGANYLILWEQIKKYLGGEYDVFDLGGTRSGSALEIFKKGWTDRVENIIEISSAVSGPENKIKKSFLRGIYGILPLGLVRMLNKQYLKYIL